MTEKPSVLTPPYQDKAVVNTSIEAVPATPTDDDSSSPEQRPAGPPPPLKIKIMAILMWRDWRNEVNHQEGKEKSRFDTSFLISVQQMQIDNTKYALLSASQDFMTTVLMPASGVLTDRMGGAKAMVYGNLIFTLGYMLIAAATTIRNYEFMVFGTVVSALGDIATQVAQYKIFSSWFPPNHGFASTLGLELGIGKVGAFVGKSSANIIAKKTGDFSWVYWTAVFMNIFTNVATTGFWYFTRYCEQRYVVSRDPATGETLTERNKKFELRKVLELPWMYWSILAFSLFETSTAIVFTQNATELAEQRFKVDSISAGWYTATLQYAGFFLVPCLGVFIDVFGNRITLLAICGTGVFIAMALANWSPNLQGTAASFGIYAVAFSIGPATIIDSIRTSLWHSSVFGSAYSLKITTNNAMNIIVAIVCGVIQDQDGNSYARVTRVYVTLAALSVAVTVALSIGSYFSKDLGRLQWTRKRRIRDGETINEMQRRFEEENGKRNRLLSMGCLGFLGVLVLGSWCAFFWGVATGNNYSG
ncbi:hypothetical protein FKW77_000097 [Venturia effusa]|uniref:Lysosomal dipeptide transporter MFSD1 n=1 Tax=Venturia effusa TaxID=50376 RepID=A0A517KYV8_9PEZI|nr:hypothetical protein FKW77_000097 [Venturia effusa]